MTSGLSAGEIGRKAVHMAVGGFAFAVRPLGPVLSVLAALTAVLFNAFVLPRIGGRRLWREGEARNGFALGIVLYPVAVLLLLLIFARHLEVAAATWGILAFGDGMASIVGMAIGRQKLPWNPAKSWAGSLAFFLFGGLAASILLLWSAPGAYSASFAIAIGFAAALFAALLESQPLGLDDNLGVPLVTGLVLFCLTLTQGNWQVVTTAEFRSGLLLGLAVNLALALAAYATGGVGRSGAATGILLGTTIWAFAGGGAFALLFAFFVLGTVATRLGYARKAAAGIAQEKGGRRGPGNALSKTSIPALAAIFAATTGYPQLFALALAGAFATAAFDTVSSEVGKAYGRRTYLITTLRSVPRGTDGAVSLEGTLSGVAAAILLAGLGALLDLYPPLGIVAVVVAATIATTLESWIGATLEKRGLLDNEAVNFLNSLAGALVAAGAGLLLV
ncbi:MAG: DUF92 domain-containing protein [Thermoanaerobaculia bacterium]